MKSKRTIIIAIVIILVGYIAYHLYQNNQEQKAMEEIDAHLYELYSPMVNQTTFRINNDNLIVNLDKVNLVDEDHYFKRNNSNATVQISIYKNEITPDHLIDEVTYSENVLREEMNSDFYFVTTRNTSNFAQFYSQVIYAYFNDVYRQKFDERWKQMDVEGTYDEDNIKYDQRGNLVEEGIVTYKHTYKTDELTAEFRTEFEMNQQNKRVIDIYVTFSDYSSEVEQGTGNTPGNIINSGIAAIDDKGWTYLNYYDGIYRFKDDINQREKVTSEVGPYINVAGDYLYFGFNSLNKVKVDGAEFEVLDEKRVRYTQVGNGWVYYVTEQEDGQKLYKMRTDGADKKLLINGGVNILAVEGNHLFATYSDEKKGIYRLDLDGNNEKQVVADQVWQFDVDNDWIYYINSDDHHNMYKAKIDGSQKTKLTIDEAWNINVMGDWIFYQNRSVVTAYENDSIGYLFKIKTNGLERQMVSKTWTNDITIIGDWIYFNEVDQQDPLGEYISRMKFDGSNKEIIR